MKMFYIQTTDVAINKRMNASFFSLTILYVLDVYVHYEIYREFTESELNVHCMDSF